MNLNALLSTLPIMAKGMLGIFIVTAVIVLCMVVLVKFVKDSPKEQ